MQNFLLPVNRDEYYALVQLLQHATNKRMGEKITGLPYTNFQKLAVRLKNAYDTPEYQEKSQPYFQCTQYQAHNANSNRYPSLVDNYGEVVYILPFFVDNIQQLVALRGDNADLNEFLYSELSSSESVMVLDGQIFVGADIHDHL